MKSTQGIHDSGWQKWTYRVALLLLLVGMANFLAWVAQLVMGRSNGLPTVQGVVFLLTVVPCTGLIYVLNRDLEKKRQHRDTAESSGYNMGVQ